MDNPTIQLIDTPVEKTVTPNQNDWLSWLKRRKLLIGAIALLVVTILIGIVLTTRPDSIVQTNNHPVTSTTPTPTPTIDAAENAYFAALPQTMVYYSFAQTSGGRNVYQADISDTHRRNISIGFPGTYTYLTSPNGHWLLRYNDHQLEQATSSAPESFSKIYSFANQQLRLTSAAFTQDSNQLLIDVSQPTDNQLYTNHLIQLTISADKTKTAPAAIVTLDKPYRLQLVGFSSPQTVWYIENRDDRLSNITPFDLSTATSGTPVTSFNSNDLLSKLQFSHDLQFAYSSSATSVTEYVVATGQSRVIYTLDRSCPKTTQQNASAISGFSASPKQSLLITVNLKSCPNQQVAKGSPTPPTQNTLVVDANTGQTLQQQNNLPITTISQSSWSPDGQSAWLTIDASTHYVLELQQLQVHAIPSLDRQTLNKEKLYLLGWLAP